MYVMRNEFIPTSSRNTKGLMGPWRGGMFQDVIINHVHRDGMPIISHSVFFSPKPDGSPRHLYTTFFAPMHTETYFSTEYVIGSVNVETDILRRKERFLPESDQCVLWQKPHFMNQLIRCSPALYRAVFQGHELHSRTFGKPRQVDVQFTPDIMDMTSIPLDTLELFMEVPLGSYRDNKLEDTPGLDMEGNGDMFDREEYTRIMNSVTEWLSAWISVMWFTEKKLHPVGANDFCLTTDRYLVANMGGDGTPHWAGLDLLTLPLYYAQRMWGTNASLIGSTTRAFAD